MLCIKRQTNNYSLDTKLLEHGGIGLATARVYRELYVRNSKKAANRRRHDRETGPLIVGGGRVSKILLPHSFCDYKDQGRQTLYGSDSCCYIQRSKSVDIRAKIGRKLPKKTSQCHPHGCGPLLPLIGMM